MDDAIPESPAAPAPRPWGFWATIGLSLVVLALFFAIQIVVVIGYFAACVLARPTADLIQLAQGMRDNGLLLSLASWASMPVCLGLVVLLVKLRRGWTIRQYLALKPVSKGAMLAWLGLLLAFVAASKGLTCLLGRPLVNEFMRNAYQTAYYLPLLWATLLVAAPVFEEAFFRGFMVPGIRQSRLGAVGAIVITAASWALLHVQYDVYAIVHIFVAGILLGVARLKTQSLSTTMAMHSLWNLVALIEVAVYQSL